MSPWHEGKEAEGKSERVEEKKNDEIEISLLNKFIFSSPFSLTLFLKILKIKILIITFTKKVTICMMQY